VKYFATTKLSENIHETPEGFLICIGVPIARTGEMIYGKDETPLEVGEDGKVIIQRDEKEVFRPETIASFEGKALTITHPVEFVTPKNWSMLAKGVIQNVRRAPEKDADGESVLLADVLIMDSIAINLVKNGLREVSCGYEAEYIQTENGKGKQTKIIGNHLALVEQGRAGSAYAINDHKGDSMTMLEKLLAKLGITKDSAMAKVIDEALKEDEKKAKDEKAEEKKDDKAKDAAAHDELVKMVKDLGEKIAAMGKPADEKKEEPAKEEEKAKDDESQPEKSLEERLKVLEAAVQKLLEMGSKSNDEEKKDDEKSEDEKSEEKEESEDAEGHMVGDTASRAEILAPGIEKSKDVKVKALKAAYDTKEGKEVINSLTGGKAPAYDSAEKVETLFIAASELLKVKRTQDLSRTKQTRDSDLEAAAKQGAMTAEKMNEINAQYYKRN
jgi:hypothetical protein